MTEEEDVTQIVTMPAMRPVEVAPRQDAESQTRETVFDIHDLSASYGTNVAVKGVKDRKSVV